MLCRLYIIIKLCYLSGGAPGGSLLRLKAALQYLEILPIWGCCYNTKELKSPKISSKQCVVLNPRSLSPICLYLTEIDNFAECPSLQYLKRKSSLLVTAKCQCQQNILSMQCETWRFTKSGRFNRLGCLAVLWRRKLQITCHNLQSGQISLLLC